MTRSGRLRTRIVWSTALVSAVAVAVMVGAVLLALSALTTRSVDGTLTDRFTVVATALQQSREVLSVTPTTPDTVQDSTWLFRADGSQVTGPPAGRRVQETARSLASVTSRTRVDRADRAYLAAPLAGRGVLVVSESLEPYEATRTQTVVVLSVLGLLVTGGATGLAAWTVSRTLRPVGSMAALAEDWSAHELDARFEATGGDDEIAHLGRTLNVLLDRVAGALRTERRLGAELAHELRTPLTAIRGEAELGLMTDPDPGTAQRLERVVSLTEELGGTITTLLAIARGETQRESRASLRAVVAAALSGHTVPAGTALLVDDLDDLDDDAHGDVAVAATVEVAVRALTPLLENALRYAATRVEVSCSLSERSVEVAVSDDGAGVDLTDSETVFLAGRRDPDSPGAGLGLALARRAARTLGGEVELTSAARPTCFTLTLPRA
ncbi:MAG: HAMP domain-containing sensor histidine kinase [Nocardioidaceae bacterium]